MNNLASATADILERAARALRLGGKGKVRALDAVEQARCMLVRPIAPEADYREALLQLGVMVDAIDEAVNDISAGRAPDDSLEGWLLNSKKDAERCAAASTTDSRRQIQLLAEAKAYGYVLERIGCEDKAR